MNLDVVRAWVTDLKETEEPQARETLFDGTGHCCLGRLCRVIGLEPTCVGRNDHAYEVEYWHFQGSTDYLPDAAFKALGIDPNDDRFDQKHYASMNDEDMMTFKQIAAEIEREFDL